MKLMKAAVMMGALLTSNLAFSENCQMPFSFAITNENAFNVKADCTNDQYSYRFWIGAKGSMPVDNVFFTNTSHDSSGSCVFSVIDQNDAHSAIKVSVTNLWDAEKAKNYCGSHSLVDSNDILRYSTTYTASVSVKPGEKSAVIDLSANAANNKLNIYTSPQQSS